MMHRRSWLETANKALDRDLGSLQRILEIFPKILELDLVSRATRVKNQLQRVSELYFEETWDTSEVITSSLDLTFSQLEYETGEFSERVKDLAESFDRLRHAYEEFVVSQGLIMLVSMLEVYLSTVFTSCLEERFGFGDRGISRIESRCNFQNWGDSVDAYRSFLGMELCPPGVSNSDVVALQQKRHVLVHQLGQIDLRAVRQLGLSPSMAGERLRIERSEVTEGINLVRNIGDHLTQAITDQGDPPLRKPGVGSEFP